MKFDSGLLMKGKAKLEVNLNNLIDMEDQDFMPELGDDNPKRKGKKEVHNRDENSFSNNNPNDSLNNLDETLNQSSVFNQSSVGLVDPNK